MSLYLSINARTALKDHIDEFFDTCAGIWTDTMTDLIFYRRIFKIDILKSFEIDFFMDTCTTKCNF